MRWLWIYGTLVFTALSVNGQTISKNFGSGANAFSIEFVVIAKPQSIPAGQYAPIESFNMGKYEVSRGIVDKANLAGALGITMAEMTSYGGNGNNKPATGISWFEAARFVNYLNVASGSAVAYKFNESGVFQEWSEGDLGYDATNPFRNSLAKYYLPNRAEWNYAAYGNPNGPWYSYPTGSNVGPSSVAGGTDSNTAVWGQSGPADITNAGGLSTLGTMGQGGNAAEWIETSRVYPNQVDALRFILGSYWGSVSNASLANGWGWSDAPSEENWGYGFRVAMAPDQASYWILTTSANDPLMGAVTLGGPKEDNSIQTVQASPNPGYIFVSWSGDISGSSNPNTVTMNANKIIIANFGQDTRDNDVDGLSNYQEIVTYGTNPNQKDSNADGIEDGQAVTLGYSPTFNFSALISHLQSHPPTGLYTASQMQAMAFGDLVLTKNANSSFTLNYDIEQSADLQTWTTYQAYALPLTNLPTNKAFVRIKAKQNGSGSQSAPTSSTPTTDINNGANWNSQQNTMGPPIEGAPGT